LLNPTPDNKVSKAELLSYTTSLNKELLNRIDRHYSTVGFFKMVCKGILVREIAVFFCCVV
jgi:hypothetical protein